MDEIAITLERCACSLPSLRDRKFAQSMLDQHKSGKELSSNQLYWVKTLASKLGQSLAAPFASEQNISDDIFDDEVLGHGLVEPHDEHAPLPGRSTGDQVSELVRQGEMIEAIKRYREFTGKGLKESKEACEAIRERMWQQARAQRRSSSQQGSGGQGPSQSQQQQKSGGESSTSSTCCFAGQDFSTALKSVVESTLTPIAQALGADLGAKVELQQAEWQRAQREGLAEEITKRALKLLDERVPASTVIEVQRADGSRHVVDGTQHPQFENLLRASNSRLSNGYAPGILLSGEAGSGKTYGTEQLARALGLNWHFNGAISFPHEMLGFIDAGGKYHTTPFREAYEHGGVYTFDEVDRSDPVALLAVNPHLANGLATFPDKQVKRHKDCIIVATANTWGYGADAQYSGATKLDAAFLSRFPVRLAWDVDEKMEQKLVTNVCAAASGEWYGKFKQARNNARASGLKVLIDTRAALAGAALVASGYSIEQAAQMTYLASLKPEQRKIIEGQNTVTSRDEELRRYR